jgi:hypothetical protein
MTFRQGSDCAGAAQRSQAVASGFAARHRAAREPIAERSEQQPGEPQPSRATKTRQLVVRRWKPAMPIQVRPTANSSSAPYT